ncbi:MAG: SDR family NAD(P)-dependent oxidoreductase [Spirochaetota bacterium]
MQKNILITGATDGIGFEAAKMLLQQGHTVLLHGRNPEKIETVCKSLAQHNDKGSLQSYQADLANLQDVLTLSQEIQQNHEQIDVVINNAGVFKTNHPTAANGLDVRFVVNTIAPYLLTKKLLPLVPESGRIINVSSAAQAPVDLQAMQGQVKLPDNAAYAQSKLAIVMWSNYLAASLKAKAMILSVNPGSLLGSKMVKEAFGIAGGDVAIGGKILARTSLEETFANASGQYFDNDSGQLAQPHPDALDTQKNTALVTSIESILSRVIPEKL